MHNDRPKLSARETFLIQAALNLLASDVKEANRLFKVTAADWPDEDTTGKISCMFHLHSEITPAEASKLCERFDMLETRERRPARVRKGVA